MRNVTIIRASCPVKGVKPRSDLEEAVTLERYNDYVQVAIPALLEPLIKKAVLEFHREGTRCFCCVVISKKGKQLTVEESHVYSHRMAASIGNNDKRFEAYVTGYNMSFTIPLYIACTDGDFHCGIWGQPWLPVEDLQKAAASLRGPAN